MFLTTLLNFIRKRIQHNHSGIYTLNTHSVFFIYKCVETIIPRESLKPPDMKLLEVFNQKVQWGRLW